MSEITNLHDLPLVVGVDIGGTQVRVAVLQGATLLSRVDLLTGENAIPERLISCIYNAVRKALDEASTRLDQIIGIGIGSPGPLDSHTGIVFDPPNMPGWHNVPLRDIFKEHYDLPVFVENDTNAAALGEYLFGAGRGSRSMVYLTISTGIGGGVIINGKILGGISGTAAELGHITIDRHGDRCNCGNIGCLESIASGTAIARRANEAMAGDIDFRNWMSERLPHNIAVSELATLPVNKDESGQKNLVDARLVAEAAAKGVPLACEIIHDAAEAIGIGLTNIIHIFNPELIILGGGVTQIGPLLIEPALHIVQERAMKVPRDAVRIVQAQLGTDAGLVGAGALIYSNIS
ncbi:MAG: ROK family protein [Ktedonobacteraceae bacterium]|nr:ROK family protein [Ktedonobacteraceae bacterium]